MALPGDDRARTLLERYLSALAHWGAHTNLVGSLERCELEVHVRDSWAASVALRRDARVVDLGSGAGFPGIPLAIARPDLALTLVEIREKRVHFLRHVVRELGLATEVVRGDIDGAPGNPFDYAVARAVAAPADLLPRARHWVHEQGEVWIWGRVRADELGIQGVSELELEEGRGWILQARSPEGVAGPSDR